MKNLQYTVEQKNGQGSVRLDAGISVNVIDSAFEVPAYSIEVGDTEVQFSDFGTAYSTVVQPDGEVVHGQTSHIACYCALRISVAEDTDSIWLTPAG